ncbi:hypothetical protein F8M41_016660 [Gigaspora margarita]|uniref:Uncharacterized protein n=1 Tax=Gigaspora margarita TaxID=4874 RepID=A0A8H4APD4_GIGMA|nr:hypothetical protein F8M41_016660 [Gigaspora margarita]
MTISQTPEYHIYNDTKLIAKIYFENDVQNKVSEYVFELCAMTNVTCPFTARNTYSAKAEFQIPVTTKVVIVSVLTEHNQYLDCEIVILKNITIPTLTTSNPTSTPHPQ